jgi:hypothetical protein
MYDHPGNGRLTSPPGRDEKSRWAARRLLELIRAGDERAMWLVLDLATRPTPKPRENGTPKQTVEP